MATFTAKDVQTLRQSTGAGMMDAKKALEATDGDAKEAAKWLREQGLIKAASRTDRVLVERELVAPHFGQRGFGLLARLVGHARRFSFAFFAVRQLVQHAIELRPQLADFVRAV